MNKAFCFITAVILSVLLLAVCATAEVRNDWLGKWYLYSYQNLKLYPYTLFLAGDETEYIDIYGSSLQPVGRE